MRVKLCAQKQMDTRPADMIYCSPWTYREPFRMTKRAKRLPDISNSDELSFREHIHTNVYYLLFSLLRDDVYGYTRWDLPECVYCTYTSVLVRCVSYEVAFHVFNFWGMHNHDFIWKKMLYIMVTKAQTPFFKIHFILLYNTLLL